MMHRFILSSLMVFGLILGCFSFSGRLRNSKVIDEDTLRNKRPESMSVSVHGLQALFVKPAQSLAPMLGMAFLPAGALKTDLVDMSSRQVCGEVLGVAVVVATVVVGVVLSPPLLSQLLLCSVFIHVQGLVAPSLFRTTAMDPGRDDHDHENDYNMTPPRRSIGHRPELRVVC